MPRLSARVEAGPPKEYKATEVPRGHLCAMTGIPPGITPSSIAWRPGDVFCPSSDRMIRIGDGNEERKAWFNEVGIKFRLPAPGERFVVEGG